LITFEFLSIPIPFTHTRAYIYNLDDLFGREKQKPDNVGFDNVGVLKIFDFGLAKELREEERTADGLYKMTGCTGAVRYMSPENALSQPYNLSTDVYSWSMIMWYLLALEPPFALYTESMIFDRVTGRGYRPKTFSSWSPRIATIIQRSWSASISNRPTFKEIAHEMKMELAEVNPKQAAFLGVSTGEE
jgi:serine/threonine protein kinase